MTPAVIVAVAVATVVVQVTALAAWPIFGGQPHLIAVGAALFLAFRRPADGLWWVLAGGALFDLLLPARVGTTLVPLLVAYLALAAAARWVVETYPWLGGIAAALVLLVATELPLAAMTGGWRQFGHDLAAGAAIVAASTLVLASAGVRPDRGPHVGL